MSALLAIVLLGFFLGMRHATDPDHVVAVTTIVSRERTLLHAALIGALWGLGHTVTIFAVGSAIILFNLTIPPRLGLSMELSVGLMLILLGVMNLTGLLRRAMEWIAIRGRGPGAHSHVILGRRIIHSHDQDDDADADEDRAAGSKSAHSSRAPQWRPQWLKTLGPFHFARPLTAPILHALARSS